MDAFSRIYEEHSDAIFKYILYLVGNMETAEDLTQDTFYRAYKAQHRFRYEANERTWLRKIARNAVIDFERRKKILKWMPFIEKETYVETAKLPEELLIKGEQLAIVFHELCTLKLEYREAIVLRVIEGLSVKEAADILGWNETKVKNNTQRGLKELRKRLE